MNNATWVILVFSLFSSSVFAQNTAQHTNLVQLLATPEKFDGALVTVRGFLVMGDHRDLVAHALYLSKDDADNLIGNSVLVVANDQMRRDEEKIDRMYVVLTGRFRVVRGADKSYIGALKDIVDCQVWSDPNRPIALKGITTQKNK